MFELFDSTLRLAVPLLFAAMAGMVCERSGVINIALEGFLLIGAFCAASATLTTHSPWIGLFAAAFGGAMLAAIYAWSVINLRANQIVAGTAINILAQGITPFFCKILY